MASRATEQCAFLSRWKSWPSNDLRAFVWHCMWWLSSVSKHFLSSAGALLSVHTVKLVPQCVRAVKPEGPQHPTWAHTWSGLIKPTCKSCHFESDSVLTRQSVDTSVSWGLPSFSCKFESKLCSPHQGFVFFFSISILWFLLHFTHSHKTRKRWVLF